MNVIDVSKIKSGKEFANIILNSNECCFHIIGEEENPILNMINQEELTPKFKLGDMVKLNEEILKFNGVSHNETFFIDGLEKVDNQILYKVSNNKHQYHFFGYELEKI